MWVLGSKPGTSARVVNDLNYLFSSKSTVFLRLNEGYFIINFNDDEDLQTVVV